MFKKIILGLLIFTCLVFIVCSTAKNEETVKTWKIPDHMIENLNYMVDDFNKRFEARTIQFKDELRANFKNYESMPEDVVMDLKNGVFIDRADYVRLMQEAQTKQATEQKIREEEK